MANSTQAFGFRAIGSANSAPYNGGTIRCMIPTTASEGALFIGDVVTLIGSASTDGYPTVKEAAVAELPYGVVASFDANPSNLELPYRAASTQRYLRVVPVEGNLFEARFDGLSEAADVGSTTIYVVGAGSTTTGLSTTALSATDVGTSVADDVRIVGFKDAPDNDLTLTTAVAIVKFNLDARGINTVGI